METEVILKILVLCVGFYMAWNIGANDVSNAMGTSVGAGALTLRKAVIIAAVLEFSGAFFLGSNVSQTMQKGLIDPSQFTADPLILIIGMSSALLGTSIWLQIASYFGWPVSTTHAIVGAILGFGALVTPHSIEWKSVSSIAASWVISPTLSGIFAFGLFYFIQHKVLFALNPIYSTIKIIPYLVAAVFSVFCLSALMGGIHQLHLQLHFLQTIIITLVVGLIAYTGTYFLLKKVDIPKASLDFGTKNLPQNYISLQKAIKHLNRVTISSKGEVQHKAAHLLEQINELSHEVRSKTSFSARTSEFTTVEKLFGYLQILSACFVAFAHGANDVANAIGPVAAVLDMLTNGLKVSMNSSIPSWLLAFGGLGIVIGLATWGWRVIETIGKKITELTPTRGFTAEFSAATTILIASKLGLPISTTHCLVGAVLGVGMARGLKALNLGMIKDIILSWVITMPASALMCIIVYFGLKAIFI